MQLLGTLRVSHHAGFKLRQHKFSQIFTKNYVQNEIRTHTNLQICFRSSKTTSDAVSKVVNREES